MVQFSGTWQGIPRLDLALKRVNLAADAASKEVVVTGGALTVKRAQGNFQGSHKKGQPHVGGDAPNVVTGFLRRSITMRPAKAVVPGTFEVRVEVNAVYGRRVENGFNGADSLGRQYNQPPYPYFAPAVKEVREELPAIAVATFAKHFAKF